MPISCQGLEENVDRGNDQDRSDLNRIQWHL